MADSKEPAAEPVTTPVKGPRVFLDYDQAELDAAYDQAVHAANLPQILKRYASNSDAARERLGRPEQKAGSQIRVLHGNGNFSRIER